MGCKAIVVDTVALIFCLLHCHSVQHDVTANLTHKTSQYSTVEIN